MKKLLALVLVLGIAGVASATYELTAVPQGSSYLISVNLKDTVGVKDAAFALLVDQTVGTITGGARGTGADEATAVNGPALPDLAGMIPDGMNGIYGLIGTYGNYAAGNYVKDAVFTFAAGKAVGTIELYTITEAGTNLEASVTVPEPITMGLLGLGGLLFVRRK